MMNGENETRVSGTLYAGRSWKKKEEPILALEFLLVISKAERHGWVHA